MHELTLVVNGSYSLSTPIGKLGLHWQVEGRLTRIELPSTATAPGRSRPLGGTISAARQSAPAPPPAWLAELVHDLERYFAGEPVVLNDRLLDFRSATLFQVKVYNRVYKIPWGQTLSYGEVAAAVGSPQGARAVGQAMAANRYPIVVPCHRVLAAHGKLGGFGGGLPMKRYLLRLEGSAY